MAADVALMIIPLVVIIAGAAAFRAGAQRLGQPAVLGELVLGFVLGAWMLGTWWPETHAVLLPAPALASLHALGWIGLALFMFTVGTEMRWRRGDLRAGASLAWGGFLLPLALGLALAFLAPAWFFDGPVRLEGAAMIGLAMAVSALPVLARILEHHGLLETSFGSRIVAAGAVGDLAAAGVLALVVSTREVGLTGSLGGNAIVLLGFLAVTLAADRGLKAWFAASPPTLGEGTLAALVCAILGSAWLTQTAGFHALVGPLAIGIVVARHAPLREFARPRLQGLTVVLFLPMFFVLAGLDADLSLLASRAGLLAVGVVLATASLGKLAGVWLGGRAAGFPPRERLAAGLALNARGAIDLVVAKIGLDEGFLSPRGFALLAVVIVLTTCMAAPLLGATLRWNVRKTLESRAAAAEPLRIHARP